MILWSMASECLRHLEEHFNCFATVLSFSYLCSLRQVSCPLTTMQSVRGMISVGLFCNIYYTRYLSFYLPFCSAPPVGSMFCISPRSPCNKSYRTNYCLTSMSGCSIRSCTVCILSMTSGGTVEIPRRAYIMNTSSYFSASHLLTKRSIPYL